MHDVGGMELGQRTRKGRAERADGSLGQGAAERDGVVQRWTDDVLGGEPGRFGGGVGGEDSRAVVVADDPGGVGFEVEAGARGRVGRDAGVHGFQGQGAARCGAREVHGAHAAVAEAGEKPVATDLAGVVVGQGRRAWSSGPGNGVGDTELGREYLGRLAGEGGGDATRQPAGCEQ